MVLNSVDSELMEVDSVCLGNISDLKTHLNLTVCVNRKETLNLEKLEAQLKACLCRISFSKAKVRIHCRSDWITAAQQCNEMLRN